MANNASDEDNVAIYIDRPNVKKTNDQYDNEVLLKGVEKEHEKIVKCNSYWAFGYPNNEIGRSGRPKKIRKSSYYLYKNNINFIPIPTFEGEEPDERKNPTDLHIAVDIMEDIYQNEHIDTFVIVTADKDFIPIVKKLIEKGKKVVVILPQNSGKFNTFSQEAGAEVRKLDVIMRKYRERE